MAMLPNSSIPHEQYIKKEIYALPVLLNELGYKSIASHPYHASGWARTTIYPLMGFSEATFIEDYPKQDFVRYYISDLEVYKYLLNKLDEKEQSEKLFIMGITMQNHGGYNSSPEEFTKTIELEGVDASYPRAEEYLSLINLSDAALEYLLTELERYEEKTVLLFFGDHLPSIEKELFDEIHGAPFSTLDEQMLQYKVPFLIWANYDIQEQTIDGTSLNYLGRYLLEAAGIELPPYFQFLKEMEESIPVITGNGYMSKEKGSFADIKDAKGIEMQWINNYSILQYNSLFDEKNMSQVFFDVKQ